jgi:hypothetical protein
VTAAAAMRRAAIVAVAAAAIVVSFWALSWSSVEALLADDAQSRADGWSEGLTPWRWKLSAPDAVVWPGSVGFERVDPSDSNLIGIVVDGNADLSLGLRGESIDLSLVDEMVIEVRAHEPARVSLIAESDGNAQTVGSIGVEKVDGFVRIPITPPSHATIDALRLHLETRPGASVAFGFGVLAARDGVSVQQCSEVQRCASRVFRIAAPAATFPETTLAWRDALFAQRPAAIVAPSSNDPRIRAFAAEVRTSIERPVFWLLATAPLLVGLLSRTRRDAPMTGLRSALELALVFAPWLLLQWAGWPSEGAPPRASYVFLACLAGALLLKPPAETWRLLGDTGAWKAVGGFVLAMLPVLAAMFFLSLKFEPDFAAEAALSPEKALRYALWALLQQWLLLRVIAPRMQAIVGSEIFGAVAAGALFGLLHVPNFALMIATGFAGSVWAWLGYRHRALLPLSVSHAVLGIALLWATPTWLVRSAEVGGRYLMPGGF